MDFLKKIKEQKEQRPSVLQSTMPDLLRKVTPCSFSDNTDSNSIHRYMRESKNLKKGF